MLWNVTVKSCYQPILRIFSWLLNSLPGLQTLFFCTNWHKRYNPFAVDVYQAGRLFYGWFSVSDLLWYVWARNTNSRPIGCGTRCSSFLELLLDMSSYNPANWLRHWQDSAFCAHLYNAKTFWGLKGGNYWSFWRMFIDIVQTGRLVIATRFVWVSSGISYIFFIPLVRKLTLLR